MSFIDIDDFRQAYVIAKNEALKSIRGKKLMAFVLIVLIMLALPVVLGYAFGMDLYSDPKETLFLYAMFMTIILVISAALFSSTTLVSEFEDRTALLVFTRPIRKTTIFVGKFIGCFVLQWAIIGLFYLGMTLLSWIYMADGYSMPFGDIGVSFLLATLALLSISSVSMVFSSFVKKASMASILSFVVFLMIIPIAEQAVIYGLNLSGMPWYLFDSVVNNATDLFYTVDIMSGMEYTVTHLTLLEDIGYIAIWVVVPILIAWYLFKRRNF